MLDFVPVIPTTMISSRSLLLAVLFLVPVPASAQYAWSDLSAEMQVRLAVQAAPPETQADATVQGWDASGNFVTLREGSNTMICMGPNPDRETFEVSCHHSDLEPYFEQNDQIMGVSGLAGDPMYPPKNPPLPPLPIGRVGNAVAKGFDKLGWHWWPSDAAILSQHYEGRDKCLNLNPCMSGCSQGAKSTTDITYWPQAIR